MEECSTCRYFKRGVDTQRPGPAYGLCARYPKEEQKHEHDGCGEHRPVGEASLKEPAKKSTTR